MNKATTFLYKYLCLLGHVYKELNYWSINVCWTFWKKSPNNLMAYFTWHSQYIYESSSYSVFLPCLLLPVQSEVILGIVTCILLMLHCGKYIFTCFGGTHIYFCKNPTQIICLFFNLKSHLASKLFLISFHFIVLQSLKVNLHIHFHWSPTMGWE